MQRRRVGSVLGGLALGTALPGQAQLPKLARVGVLSSFAPSPSRPTTVRSWAAFRAELRSLGWSEGRNLVIEARFSEGQPERDPPLAAELVASGVDVIVAGGSQATHAVRRATTSIPIVMHGVSHAVESGFVATLARPGGNVTGVTNQLNDLQAKHLELLLAIVPDFSRIGVLWSPNNSDSALAFADMQATAAKRGLVLRSLPVDSPAALTGALEEAQTGKLQALHVHPTAAISSGYRQIVEWATTQRVATISGFEGFTRAGFLLSYGPEPVDDWRKAAGFVDRILRGAKPAELPVQQPTKFNFFINRGTADAIGLTIPADLLLAAELID